MSNERSRRVRDVYSNANNHRLVGTRSIFQPPMPLPPVIANDEYMEMDNVPVSESRGRVGLALQQFNRDMQVDEPADLSLRRVSSSSNWRREPEVANDGVLDLARRPSRVSADAKDENCVRNDVNGNSDSGSTSKLNGHANGVSDEEEPSHADVPPLVLKELSVEEVKKRQKRIKMLKAHLRAEEMKLVLLKKMQLSHQLNVLNAAHGAAKSLPVKQNGNTNNHTNSNSSRVGSDNGSSQLPPPLARGQNSLLKPANAHAQFSHHLKPPNAHPQNAHGTSSLIQNHSRLSNHSSSNHHAQMLHQQSNLTRNHNSAMHRTPVTTPPNIVMGYQMPSVQSQVQTSSSLNSSNSSSQVANQGSMETPHQRGDSLSRMQSQQAAKLALRKQLEKTLLQIPPPKPPPPELHFIPNPSNTEFIYLVGLESVVNFITEGDRGQEDEAPKPFSCVQCNIDFTPVWKWENTKKGTVICELCVTSNIKKALKAEHTNRLKKAFVKALQQEQEIEQRMSLSGMSPPSSPVAHSSSNIAPPPPPPPPPQVAPLLQLPKMNDPVRQAHANAAAAAAAAHQQLLRLPLSQPLPAHMLSPMNPYLAHAYQYQLLGKNPVSSAELQRQYLLDMIPPRSLSQQGPMNWKT